MQLREIENHYWFILKDPQKFYQSSFRTVRFEKPGVLAITGHLYGEDRVTIQSLKFDKRIWSEAEARAWIGGHRKRLHLNR